MLLCTSQTNHLQPCQVLRREFLSGENFYPRPFLRWYDRKTIGLGSLCRKTKNWAIQKWQNLSVVAEIVFLSQDTISLLSVKTCKGNTPTFKNRYYHQKKYHSLKFWGRFGFFQIRYQKKFGNRFWKDWNTERCWTWPLCTFISKCDYIHSRSFQPTCCHPMIPSGRKFPFHRILGQNCILWIEHPLWSEWK